MMATWVHPMRDLYSCLASLIRAQVPESLGLDADCHTLAAEDAETLDRLAGKAHGARYSLMSGLAVLGKALISEETARELGTADVQAVGDFVLTLAETLRELSELEITALDALAGIKAREVQQ
jgi:hypothetical protein